MPADLAHLIARFRAILRPGVLIVCATLRADGNLDATIRLSDGREGSFIVVFLDQEDDPDPSHVLIIEDAADQSSA